MAEGYKYECLVNFFNLPLQKNYSICLYISMLKYFFICYSFSLHFVLWTNIYIQDSAITYFSYMLDIVSTKTEHFSQANKF